MARRELGQARHHRIARERFEKETDDLILCRVTQMSLLRLIANPAIMGEDVITRSEAWRIVDQIWSDDRVLWADEPDQLEAVFRASSPAMTTAKSCGQVTTSPHSLRQEGHRW